MLRFLPFRARKRLAPFARRIDRLEWPLILLLLAPAAALWIFVEIADEVVEGTTASFDRTVLLAFRTAGALDDPIGPQWFEEMVRDFTALGGTGVLTLVTVLVAGYLLVTRASHSALAIVVAVATGILLSTLTKMGFDRPRPDLVPHGSYVVTASFPSGHSMMSAVVYLTLGAMLARVQAGWAGRVYVLAAAIVIVVLVGVSRVYLGVHWPTDVLAGWAVGAGWALMWWSATLWLQNRGAVETPSPPGAGEIGGHPGEERATNRA